MRCVGGALGERAHLVGDHGEALARLARARRLDPGVEREQVGLEGDAVDHVDDAGDLARRFLDAVHRRYCAGDHLAAIGGARMRFGNVATDIGRVARGLVHHLGDLTHRGRTFLQIGGLLLGAPGEIVRGGADLRRAVQHMACRCHAMAQDVGQLCHGLVEAGAQRFIFVGETRVDATGQLLGSERVQPAGQLADDKRLFLLGGKPRPRGFAEDLDRGDHVGNLVDRLVDLGPRLEIAASHPPHGIGDRFERGDRIARQQPIGCCEHQSKDEPRQRHAPIRKAGLSRAGFARFSLIGGRLLDQLVDLAAMCGIGAAQGIDARRCRRHVAALQAREKATFNLCKELLRGRIDPGQLRLERIGQGRGGPVRLAGLIFALQFCQSLGMAPHRARLDHRQARFQIGFQNIDGRRQDIGDQIRCLLVCGNDRAADADRAQRRADIERRDSDRGEDDAGPDKCCLFQIHRPRSFHWRPGARTNDCERRLH